MGLLSFQSAFKKVDLYKKIRDAPNANGSYILGDIFFRNSMAKEEQEKEKRLGYAKYHLSEKIKNKGWNIIWPKSM
eukprot:5119039-Pyramimonas_sp.AAC.1